jgi:hypothetical protein
MSTKRTRKSSTSSGDRKAARAGKQLERRGPAIADMAARSFMKRQDRDRWPSDETQDKAFEMLKNKRMGTHRGNSIRKGQRGIRPAKVGFTFLDAVIDKGNLDKLLTAAYLKLKKVRRYPGFVLIRTYNLKNRPITII